jgi:hypothetical protein
VTSGGSPEWVEREGFRIDPAVVEVARGARMVAAPTDDGRDPTYATVRHAAAILASQAGARVVLADRSTESRFVDPYGSGPMTDDAGPMYSHGERLLDRRELNALGRAYLVEQLDELGQAGVDGAGWLARRPGLPGLEELVRRFPVDVVVVASGHEHPTRLERLRRGSRVDQARAAAGRAAVVWVHPDRTVRIDPTEPNGSS